MSLFEADLGPGRSWMRVGDAYEITRKPRGLDRAALAEIPFAPMDAIPQGGAYDATFTMRAPSDIASGTYFEAGDILVSKITPSFENGKQAWVRTLPTPFGYATTEVIPLRPRSGGHDPRFLFFYLLHPDVRHFVAERMEGSTGRQRVPETVLLDLAVPDFDLEEQERIGRLLEVLHTAAGHEALVGRVAEQLRRATRQQLFTRGLQREGGSESPVGPIPESWAVDRLGARHSVASGGTPSRRTSAYWDGGTIPWVKTAEIDYGTIFATEERITGEALQASAAKRFPAGTVLLAMYGQGVTRGRVAILGIDAACNQACAAIQPSDGAVSPRFLYHYLSANYERIRSLAHGGQQQNLNLDIVRNFPIAFPRDASEQDEIVAILDAIDRKIDLHRRKRAVLEDLFKSLLHKLITGEIRVADLDLSALDGTRAEVSAG